MVPSLQNVSVVGVALYDVMKIGSYKVKRIFDSGYGIKKNNWFPQVATNIGFQVAISIF